MAVGAPPTKPETLFTVLERVFLSVSNMACQRAVRVAGREIRDLQVVRCLRKSKTPFARRRRPSEGAR